MPLLTIIAIFAAVVILISLSFWVVWLREPQRLIDHFARSSVQAAIAIASVLVAVLLFRQQIQERDTQALAQQRLVLSSYLQTQMRQLVIRSRTMVPKLIYDHYRCDPAELKCDPKEDDAVEGMRSELALAMEDKATYVQFSLPIDRSEFWKVIRDSPLIDEEFFEKFFQNMIEYETDVEVVGYSMDDLLDQYREEKTKHDKELVPPSTMEDYLKRLAAMRVREARGVAQYVCYLSDRINELRGKPHSNLKFDVSIDRSCPPYGDHFEQLSAAAKSPTRARLQIQSPTK